ncbi:hypothetical protein Y032_0947g3163 [Ancylostoma ceylanicum]|nr:hypothetical protein Y032_0947g3163 [Ancylostoma ceylanicum]
MHSPQKDKVNLYQMRLSGVRIHLRKIVDEDRSMRHEILNEKKARPSRGRKRVRLSCDCDANSPYPLSYRRTRVSRTSCINCPINGFRDCRIAAGLERGMHRACTK